MKTCLLITCVFFLAAGFTGCASARYNVARQRENVSSFADNFRGGESVKDRAERNVRAYQKPEYLQKRTRAFSDNFWTSPLDTRLSSNPYDYARPKEVFKRPDPDEFLIQRILADLP